MRNDYSREERKVDAIEALGLATPAPDTRTIEAGTVVASKEFLEKFVLGPLAQIDLKTLSDAQPVARAAISYSRAYELLGDQQWLNQAHEAINLLCTKFSIGADESTNSATVNSRLAHNQSYVIAALAEHIVAQEIAARALPGNKQNRAASLRDCNYAMLEKVLVDFLDTAHDSVNGGFIHSQGGGAERLKSFESTVYVLNTLLPVLEVENLEPSVRRTLIPVIAELSVIIRAHVVPEDCNGPISEQFTESWERRPKQIGEPVSDGWIVGHALQTAQVMARASIFLRKEGTHPGFNDEPSRLLVEEAENGEEVSKKLFDYLFEHHYSVDRGVFSNVNDFDGERRDIYQNSADWQMLEGICGALMLSKQGRTFGDAKMAAKYEGITEILWSKYIDNYIDDANSDVFQEVHFITGGSKHKDAIASAYHFLEALAIQHETIGSLKDPALD